MLSFILRTFTIMVMTGLIFIGVIKAQVLPENSLVQTEDSTDHQYERVYTYLDINLNDEKSMFKISPQYYLSKRYQYFNLKILYEIKVSKTISFSVNNMTQISSNKVNTSFYSLSLKTVSKVYNSTGVSFRYYYLMKRNIKEGISGDNLNGLYIEMGFSDIFNFNFSNEPYSQKTKFISIQNYSLNIGLQRRINKWSFYDVFLQSGISKQFENYYSGIGFRIGFAL